MSKAPQIFGSGDEEFGIIPELADAGVALITEQGSDNAGLVAMIDVEFVDFAVAHKGFRLSANCAFPILLLQHLIVSLAAQAISLLKMVCPQATLAFIGAVAVSRQSVLVVDLVLGQILSKLAILLDAALTAGSILRYASYALIVALFAYKLGDVLLRESLLVALALIFAIRGPLFRGRVRPLAAPSLPTAFAAKSIFKSSHEIFIVAVRAKVGDCLHTRSLSPFVVNNNTTMVTI